MTKEYLSELLGFSSYVSVTYALRKALKAEPEKFKPIYFESKTRIDLDLEEILTICKYLRTKLNYFELQLIKDTFVKPKKRFEKICGIYVDGTEQFLKTMGKYKYKVKACQCCSYMAPRVQRSCHKPTPFCKFYNRYIYTVKIMKDGEEIGMNYLKDYCPSFERTKKPLFLFKKKRYD